MWIFRRWAPRRGRRPLGSAAESEEEAESEPAGEERRSTQTPTRTPPATTATPRTTIRAPPLRSPRHRPPLLLLSLLRGQTGEAADSSRRGRQCPRGSLPPSLPAAAAAAAAAARNLLPRGARPPCPLPPTPVIAAPAAAAQARKRKGASPLQQRSHARARDPLPPARNRPSLLAPQRSLALRRSTTPSRATGPRRQ